jgi:predicted ATPase
LSCVARGYRSTLNRRCWRFWPTDWRVSASRKALRIALATARDRKALALEVRAAADLRRVELASGRIGDAATVLQSVVEKFTEGHHLPDLREAIELLG